MALYPLTGHFASFFKKLNPSPSFVETAAHEYAAITSLIENADGNVRALSPYFFLQGSYKQDTAIYTINDVDIVALCDLWHPGGGSGQSWSRDDIFSAIEQPLRNSPRYSDKVDCDSSSMCIKVDLGIKVEILPVVFRSGCSDTSKEPFRLFRPETRKWEDGYARHHQALLTKKNKDTKGNFIPCIKVFKHLRSKYELDAVSFHIECLLYSLPDEIFSSGPADYIGSALSFLSVFTPEKLFESGITTPCGERLLFSDSEWDWNRWENFHTVLKTWARCSTLAKKQGVSKQTAIEAWRILLDDDFFPMTVPAVRYETSSFN